GFLSESAGFARACGEAGLTFIGPRPETLALMGDKVAARKLAAEAGVPTVPGTSDPVSGDDVAIAAAREIGFPLLIKAAGGGGGKGMRSVVAAAELPAALAQARREAASSFGDGSVYLEKLIERPRHIEVQLFGDGQGSVVHLGERECSVQRRFQKVVEEAPAPGLREGVRAELLDAAVRIGSRAVYRGAGTIEFLYEPSSERFYFIEVNARLQVEHPVTELVTGVDLVRAQLRLAMGAALEEALGPAESRGHAIELRVSAEDPSQGWIPSTGQIALLREPAGPGIRMDSACEPGMEVTPYYDPLLAKLIAWGRTRDEAIDRLRRALDEYVLTGVHTTLPFHRWLMRDEAFRAGELSTAFVAERWLPAGLPAANDEAAEAARRAAAEERGRRQPRAAARNGATSRWVTAARVDPLR
ncbi:MAG TPA: biotin carboxylase N-terminal domain-containing protein, partial [Chloroflexota bacterium]|nr:biotin carboxylase N-terminal domain-containing protein [Chloroflexota bacterium]